MKKILLVTKLSLKNARKGTPLRIINISRQLSGSNKLFLSAPEVEDDLRSFLVPDIPATGIKRFLRLRKLIKNENIDIIYANTDIEIVLPVILKLATRIKIVIDLHGLYAEEMYYEKLISNIKRIFIDQTIKFLLRFYDLVLVASDKLKDYYSKNNQNIELLYNGVDISRFAEITINKSEIFTIGYMGNTKPYQGFVELLQAASRIRKENLFPFRLNLIISSGAKEIDGLLSEHDLTDITDLHIKVDHSEINRLISSSHVLVVPRLSTMVTEYAYPSKLPECLLTGIPTITTAVGPVDKLFGPCRCCLIISPENIVDNLVAAIRTVFFMDRSANEEMGIKAREFVKNNLSWNVLGQKLNSYIEKI